MSWTVPSHAALPASFRGEAPENGRGPPEETGLREFGCGQLEATETGPPRGKSFTRLCVLVLFAVAEPIDRRDLLLYIRSEDALRWVLPPDAQDPVLKAVREGGCGTFAAGTYTGHAGASETTFASGRYGGKPIHGKMIPQEEEEAIRRVGSMVLEQRRTIHVVDVGRETALRRLIAEHLHHIQRFPVLCRSDGRRLEGPQEFTPENLEKIFSD